MGEESYVGGKIMFNLHDERREASSEQTSHVRPVPIFLECGGGLVAMTTISWQVG